MRLLVTRPREDAEVLAVLLRERGVETIIEPLISIRDVDGPGLDLAGVQALLITSANGIRAFSRRQGDRDIAVFAIGDASVGSDILIAIEDVTGSIFGDVLTGNAADNSLLGLAGDDFIDGGIGDDVIAGDAGDDAIVFDAADVTRVDGGAGNDVLVVNGETTVARSENAITIARVLSPMPAKRNHLLPD